MSRRSACSFNLSNYPLLQQIGNTPLVKIDLFADEFPGVDIYAKAEMYNPGSSIKDRPVLRMLTEAVLAGELTPDKIILDSTSGNAGIAYAMIGAALGYRVELVIPSNASEERKKRIQAHEAKIIYTDAIHGYDEALREALRRYEAHLRNITWQISTETKTTGVGIMTQQRLKFGKQTGGKVTHFVAGVGTGGTITGIGRRFKQYNAEIQICCIAPDEFPGIEGLKPLGRPGNIVPEILDENIIDSQNTCHNRSGV